MGDGSWVCLSPAEFAQLQQYSECEYLCLFEPGGLNVFCSYFCLCVCVYIYMHFCYLKLNCPTHYEVLNYYIWIYLIVYRVDNYWRYCKMNLSTSYLTVKHWKGAFLLHSGYFYFWYFVTVHMCSCPKIKHIQLCLIYKNKYDKGYHLNLCTSWCFLLDCWHITVKSNKCLMMSTLGTFCGGWEGSSICDRTMWQVCITFTSINEVTWFTSLHHKKSKKKIASSVASGKEGGTLRCYRFTRLDFHAGPLKVLVYSL